MSVARYVLVGAAAVVVFDAVVVVAWLVAVDVKTRQTRRQVAELMDDLTRIERSQW